MIGVLFFVGFVCVAKSSGVRKCCRQGEAITNATSCDESTHLWMYANASYGMPECADPRLELAEKGASVACMDSFPNGTVAAVVCPDDEENNSTVLEVVLLSKCCPVNNRFDSETKFCRGPSSESDRRVIQRFLNVLASGYEGIVDLNVGFPRCSHTEVLVDYLVPNRNIWRRESESVKIKVPGENRSMILNPEDVCIDVTEDHNTMVVRVCQDANLMCGVRGETCVRKCCPEGKYIGKRKCADSIRPLNSPIIHNIAKDRITPLEGRNVFFRYGDPCPDNKYVLNPDKKPNDDAYYIDHRGQIYLPKGNVFTDNYCLEDVIKASGNSSYNGTYVFICFPEEEESSSKLTLWIPAGLVSSCFFLLVTFVVYACLPSLRNLHGKTLMCYVASLLAGFLCLATMQLNPAFSSHLSCSIVASLGQFSFLAAFCWLNVISFDIWWTFGGRRLNAHIGRKQRDIRRFIVYSIYAWGASLALTGLTVLSDKYGYFQDEQRNEQYCWFVELTVRHILFFLLPQVLIVGSNVVFYVLTAINCSRVKNELNRFKHTAKEERRFHADFSKMVMNIKLFIVMGISWAVDIVSMFMTPESWGWFLPDAANCLQGLLIFAIFVLKGKVLKALGRKFACSRSGNLKEGRQHRPSTSTLFTVVSSDAKPNNCHSLTKSASDSKLNVLVVKRNNLNVSMSDFKKGR